MMFPFFPYYRRRGNFNYTYEPPKMPPKKAMDIPTDNLCKEKEEKTFEIFGLTFRFDDILLIALLFLLYQDDCDDYYLFMVLLLLLCSN